MLLADYHIVFIIISFFMLFLSLFCIFIEQYKEGIIVGGLLCGINWAICLINYMAFFGVGLPGVDSTGAVTVTTYSGMYSIFALFFALQWVNLILIFVCWYKWMILVHAEDEAKERAEANNMF